MTPEEERRHWWIRTRFEYLGRGVDQAAARFSNLNLLEMGCGTAQNLRYLRDHPVRSRSIKRLVGVEPALNGSIDAAQIQLVRTLDELGSDERFEMLVAMDVLEHIDDHVGALRGWTERTVNGGFVFITVPAFDWLWSDHDGVLQHKRRYTKRSLIEVARQAGLAPVSVSYAFGCLLPVFYLVRHVFPRPADVRGTDLRKTHPVLNSALTALGKVESKLGGNPLFGTSVIGLFKK